MSSCFIEIDKQHTIEIELFDTSVSKKFLNQLKWHLANSSINQSEAFYGYAEEDFVKQSLLQSITNINKFLKHEFIKLPNVIDWEDSWIYNHLHEFFEKLNGEWGKQTIIMAIAPTSIKNDIRNLNFSIHRLESRPYKINRKLYLSWDKNSYQREKLDPTDYNHFTFEYNENYVYLSYVEVGKHLLELYRDGLTPNYNAYKNLHYVGAEIEISWDRDNKLIFDNNFYNWAQTFNIDITDKQLGIGLLPVGIFKGSDNNFTKDSKITNIIIEE